MLLRDSRNAQGVSPCRCLRRRHTKLIAMLRGLHAPVGGGTMVTCCGLATTAVMCCPAGHRAVQPDAAQRGQHAQRHRVVLLGVQWLQVAQGSAAQDSIAMPLPACNAMALAARQSDAGLSASLVGDVTPSACVLCVERHCNPRGQMTLTFLPNTGRVIASWSLAVAPDFKNATGGSLCAPTSSKREGGGGRSVLTLHLSCQHFSIRNVRGLACIPAVTCSQRRSR